MSETVDINLTGPEFARLANNFYNASGIESHQNRINVDANLLNYFFANHGSVKKKSKVAFLWICLNPPYWEFAKPMIEGAKQFFLPGQDVDYFLWSDMPNTEEKVSKAIIDHFDKANVSIASVGGMEPIQKLSKDVALIPKMERVTVFPTEPIEWPMPTLYRYHTFLQQEEILKDYDYIFYCDVDMMFVDIVGDEILGEGLTATMNPMYVLAPSFYPPYEPNPASTAYIKRPGMIVTDPTSQTGGKRFMPQYYAGGFQGGKAADYLKAMKVLKKNIDIDFRNNYIAIWNEESHWNRYLFENPPALVLSQSYLYPDSLHQEYYIPRWGRDYPPKLVTLTKKFSLRPLSSQEQEQITMMKPK